MSVIATDAVESDSATSWAGLSAIWWLYLSFGLVGGSFAPLITEVRGALDIGAGRMGLLLGFWQLVYLASSVPVSKFIDRFGLTWSIAIGGAFMACSGFLRAVAPTYPTMLVAVVLFGMGGPFISIGAPKFVATSFGSRHRARAVGIYVTAPPLGTSLAAAGTHSVLIPVLGGWRAVFVFHGTVTLLSTGLWLLVRIRQHRAAERGQAADGEAQRTSIRSLLRTSAMWPLMAFAFVTFAVNHALGSWTVELLRDNGFDDQRAGTVASVPVLVGILAVLIIPRIADGAGRTATIVIVQITGAVAVLALLDPQRWGFALAVPLVAIGCLRASALPLATLMIMGDRRLGGVHAGASVGVYFAFGEFGGLVGPLMSGLLVEQTGSFDAIVWAVCSMSLAGAAAGAAASRVTDRVLG